MTRVYLDPNIYTAEASYVFSCPSVSNLALPADEDRPAVDESFWSAAVAVPPAEPDIQSATRLLSASCGDRATQAPHGRLTFLYSWIARRHSLLLLPYLHTMTSDYSR